MGNASYKATQNSVLFLCYSLLLGFSFMRLHASLSSPGGRRVITRFNALITLSALCRVLLCALPFLYHWLSPSYSTSTTTGSGSESESSVYDRDVYAHSIYGRLTSHERMEPGTSEKLLIFLFELVLSLGNWSLYGVFILISCYWAYMLKKVYGQRGADETADANATYAPTPTIRSSTVESDLYNASFLHTNSYISRWTQHYDSIQLFNRVMTFILAIQIFFYFQYIYYGVWSDLVLHDSMLLSSVAIVVLIGITYLSAMINQVLATMEISNRSAARVQIQRIYMIMMVANVFFYTRVLLEGVLAAYLWYIILGKETHNILIPEPYWSIYIGIKHSTEIIVLTLELLVSTAIRSYENPKVNVRHVPKLFKPGFSYHSVELNKPTEIELGVTNSDRPSREFDVANSMIGGSLEETQPILSNQYRRGNREN